METQSQKSRLLLLFATLKETKSQKNFIHCCSVNGHVERENHVPNKLAAFLQNFCNWPIILHALKSEYNSSVHSFTNQTPFFMMFNRHPEALTNCLYSGEFDQKQQEETDNSTALHSRYSLRPLISNLYCHFL